MKLVSITLSGFKSFAKKTTIDVRERITGIVGPNGSGKSNVAEAIRFVLGEQSMKSMRGTTSPDLIFKGSSTLQALSRAKVSMVLDTREKKEYGELVSEAVKPFLLFDEVTLSREVFSDGGSTYTLNGATVRLKDVQELFALLGIGTSKHTILNQGEADRILLLPPSDRRELIEDALGLRIYQVRLKESTRKLEKVDSSLENVIRLEKEGEPHLDHLKRQIEKIEKSVAERTKLESLLQSYIGREHKRLLSEEKGIDDVGSSYALTLILESVEKELKLSKNGNHQGGEHHSLEEELRNKRASVEEERALLSKEIGRLEGELGFLSRENEKEGEESLRFTKKEAHQFKRTAESHVENVRHAIRDTHFDVAEEELDSLKGTIVSFVGNEEDNTTNDSASRIATINEELVRQKGEEELLRKAILSLDQALREEKQASEERHKKVFEEEKRLLLLGSRVTELRGLIALQKEKEDRLEQDKQALTSLIEEGRLFVGHDVDGFRHAHVDTHESLRRDELLRAIEKSKIRIEEIGVLNHEEVTKEYETARARKEYIEQEIRDIRKTKEELEHLIKELTAHVKTHFKEGVTTLSTLFDSYFQYVFPGGKASLSIVDVVEDEEMDEDEEIHNKGLGVEIHVSLPAKKIKSLALLSGGEKALTSIALLFAMASITPPPFIVLDETDAPLDEHNAKRYGEMLGRLAEKSNLLVITHNRETMHFCDMLYGVTLGTDGGSRLLSISLSEAK